MGKIHIKKGRKYKAGHIRCLLHRKGHTVFARYSVLYNNQLLSTETDILDTSLFEHS